MALTLESKKKGLTTRNTHVMCENSITYDLKVIFNVTYLCRQTNRETDRQPEKQTYRANTICTPPLDLSIRRHKKQP